MSSNNKETFQWNEKLVEDLATSMYPEEFRQTIINHIAKFKLFKLPAPEGKGEGWEIICFRHKEHNIKVEIIKGLSGNGYAVDQYLNDPINSIKDGSFEIYSVKRLSDGEIFSVGDKVMHKCGNDIGIISKLQIYDDTILVDFIGNHNGRQDYKFTNCFSVLVKLKKPILFTTSDGKDVYGDTKELWRVFTVPHSFEMWKPYNIGIPNAPIEGEVYFSTESAAKEYILLNKPVLSVNDIKEVGELAQCAGSKMVLISFEKLEAFAKSKIDKP